MAVAVWISSTAAVAEELSLRLRVEWSGPAARQWQGRLECDGGQFGNLRPLGGEAASAATQWVDGSDVAIEQRTPVGYDGFDVTVTAPDEARLVIGMSPLDGTSSPRATDIGLTELLFERQTRDLDDAGTRITVRRAPGDVLRVRSIHRAWVFAPGDPLRMELDPYALPTAEGTHVRFDCELRRSDAAADPLWNRDAYWSKHFDGTVGPRPAMEALPIELSLPQEEGAYYLKIVAWARNRLALRHVLAERHVQLLVVGDEPRRELGISIKTSRQLVTEIDPAHATWWNKVSNIAPVPVPGLKRGPWGNGQSQTWPHALGTFVQLGTGGSEPAVGWQAYPLSISNPGKLHWLEIEHPSNVPQTLGISIVDPATGEAAPLSLDSGFYVPDEAADSPPHIARHRIPFWPRSRSPLVLLSNQRESATATFGKIRAFEVRDGRLPYRFKQDSRPAGRLLAAYLDRPLLPENFGAAKALDGPSQLGLDDWNTFQQAADRLVEYLHHVGYNGLLLNVAGDGGAIYPSEVLPATPKYDSGAFFANGQDPQPKDVLELLFRLFDREGLRLVPVVRFATPLPALEALRRAGGPDNAGIELIGSSGRPWSEEFPASQGQAPYYNPLDPRVQQAMLDVLQEITARYGHHPAFGGLSIQLSADGYAQLPSARCCLDDQTIERFNVETGRQVPGAGPTRFAQRWDYLSTKARKEWLDWRAKSLENFYRAAAEEVLWTRADASLYLAGTGMFDNAELTREWRPSLPRSAPLDRMLLDIGISPNLQRNVDGVVFFRPQVLEPPRPLHLAAVDLEMNDSPDLDKPFREAPRPAAFFYHPPQTVGLDMVEKRGTPRPLPNQLQTQFLPSEDRNRQRFVHSLATLDSQVLCDGGGMLPLGQDDSLADVVAAFRQLPAKPFDTLPNTPQPVTVRVLADGGQTHVYLANDSPWPTRVQIRVTSPEPFNPEELRGQAAAHPPDDDGLWTVYLQPYDLAWGAFPSPKVVFGDPQVALSQQVAEDLESRLNDLQALAAALQTPSPLAVPQNAGFEGPASDGLPAGWSVRPGISAVVDESQPHEGQQSLRITSSGDRGSLVSEPFEPPTTGRLAVSVWLRVPSGSVQPPLRLAVEGQLDNSDYYRYASVGAGKSVTPVGAQWSQYIFQISDLPLSGLSQLRVRFDLLGSGEVGIDKLQLYDLVFSKDERIELDSRIVALARAKLRRGEVGDCSRILDGYWPRMLAGHIQLTEVPRPAQPAPAVASKRTKPADNPTVADNRAGSTDKPAAKPEETRKPGFFERFRALLPGRN
ncbi:MAG: family 10 glycosylhydrolase [Pirellulales bacterium]